MMLKLALIALALTASTSFAESNHFSDLPGLTEDRVACAISAAKKYEIPINVLLAVAQKENGKPGQWVRNSNGTHDVGVMQFNTSYLNDLKKHGITAAHVEAPGCYPFELAAWRLRGHIMNDKGDTWTKAANYHSRTPKYNAIYRADLIEKARAWQIWLDNNFLTTSNATAQLQPEATPQPRILSASKSTSYVPRQITFSSMEEHKQ